MITSESDEMTAVWSNDSLTFTFYATFSTSILSWITFVKDFLILCFGQKVTKWLLCDQMTA